MNKKIPILPVSKCSRCKDSSCCTYITQAFETSCDQHDFQNLRWQVAHEHVSIIKDDNGWFLLIDGRCEHLQPDGLCGIYETRPLACCEYSEENCEFEQDIADMFKLYFPDYDSLLAHCKKKFSTGVKLQSIGRINALFTRNVSTSY